MFRHPRSNSYMYHQQSSCMHDCCAGNGKTKDCPDVFLKDVKCRDKPYNAGPCDSDDFCEWCRVEGLLGSTPANRQLAAVVGGAQRHSVPCAGPRSQLHVMA